MSCIVSVEIILHNKPAEAPYRIRRIAPPGFNRENKEKRFI